MTAITKSYETHNQNLPALQIKRPKLICSFKIKKLYSMKIAEKKIQYYLYIKFINCTKSNIKIYITIEFHFMECLSYLKVVNRELDDNKNASTKFYIMIQISKICER